MLITFDKICLVLTYNAVTSPLGAQFERIACPVAQRKKLFSLFYELIQSSDKSN